MNPNEKRDWRNYYEAGLFILLIGAGIHVFTRDKPNTLEEVTTEIIQDSVPQVTNYEFIHPLIPVYKDPISNVYNPEQQN